MALTEAQKNELNIAQTRINKGSGTDADKANIAYATANLGYIYTPTPTGPTGPVPGDVSGTGPFLPTPGPTLDEATNQATSSQQYQQNLGLLDKSQALTEESFGAAKEQTQQGYARTREDTMRMFQDALDEINRQAREVGIGVRAGSAQRNLYDASGELSGIGQGVAARAIEPLNVNTRKLAESKGLALTRMNEDELNALGNIDRQLSQARLTNDKAKIDLLNQSVQGIMDAAKERQEQELDVFKVNRALYEDIRDAQLAADKFELDTPGTRANQLKVRTEQESKGRTYISTPAQRDALLAQGFDLITIGNDVFALSAQEQADLDKKRLDSQIALSGGSGSSSGFNYSKPLSITEAQKLGVPIGTTWSEVIGITIPDYSNNFEQFSRDYPSAAGIVGLDGPELDYVSEQAFNRLRQAQQYIDSLGYGKHDTIVDAYDELNKDPSLYGILDFVDLRVSPLSEQEQVLSRIDKNTQPTTE